MKCFCTVLLALMLLVVTGCNEPGMNKKLALSDAIGVAATGATLDEAKDFDKTKAKVIEVALGLRAFVESGNLSALPFEDVRKALEDFMIKKGWGNYAYLVDTVLTYVKQQHVDTTKIGEHNVLLIKTALDGIIRQAERSRKEWAVPWKGGVSAPRPSRTAGR